MKCSMPAEWYRHSATILTYPHNRETFFDMLEKAKDEFVEFVKVVSLEEKVYINVNSEGEKEELGAKLKKRCVKGDIEINIVRTNDSWCRDYVPTFTVKDGELCAILWEFNGWGKKYLYEDDKRAGEEIAKILEAEIVKTDIVMEGGAIEVNSEGVLMTTESCVLNKNRNPDKSKEEIEKMFKELLEIKEVLWLPGGDIEGDDTDGHIDNIARFLNDRTVAVSYTEDKSDKNYGTLDKNYRFLKDTGRFEIVKIPLPEPMYYDYPWGRMRLPASYLNFYISNFGVIVPTFGCKQDDIAIGMLKEYFPDKLVIGLDARGIIVGQGAFHCLTQQVPLVKGRNVC